METWTISWAIRNLLSELLTPPSIWIVCVLLMLFLIKKNGPIKKILIVFGLTMVWFSCTSYFANQLMQTAGYFLEWPQPLKLDGGRIKGHIKSQINEPIKNQTKQENEGNSYGKSKDSNSNQTKVLSPLDGHQLKSEQLNAREYTQGIALKQFSNEVATYAIVILGGGRQKAAQDLPEYQYQNLSHQSMERLRAGARLAKATNLPVLLSGGAPDRIDAKDLSEAKVMSMVLKQELGVDARWLEEQSNTTQENALQSAKILHQEGIKTIFLVTHFWHMPRAKAQFEKQGLTVIESPMGFYQKEQFTPLDFYPSNEGFQRVRWVWHELLGSLWYRIKF
jgi:uncharacterized SAM-binding protein YcdF (DUF218 family)